MFYYYNGCSVFYKFIGRKDGEINLFLHGWGGEGKNFSAVIDKFKNKRWLIVDFPPFGKSGRIKDWTIFTYANMIICLLDHLKIDKCNVLGHSFGGRVGIILSARNCERVNKLVLIDSAGMKPKRRLKYYYRIWKYKRLKRMGKDTSRFGSPDYLKLSEDMKGVFNSVVNTYLDEYCRDIKCPTLIIWGEKDKETPIYMADRLNRLIFGSNLVILDNAGHFSFLDRNFAFCKILKDFLEV